MMLIEFFRKILNTFFIQKSMISVLFLIYQGRRQVKRKVIIHLEHYKPFQKKIEKNIYVVFLQRGIFITKLQSQQSPVHK